MIANQSWWLVGSLQVSMTCLSFLKIGDIMNLVVRFVVGQEGWRRHNCWRKMLHCFLPHRHQSLLKSFFVSALFYQLSNSHRLASNTAVSFEELTKLEDLVLRTDRNSKVRVADQKPDNEILLRCKGQPVFMTIQDVSFWISSTLLNSWSQPSAVVIWNSKCNQDPWEHAKVDSIYTNDGLLTSANNTSASPAPTISTCSSSCQFT